MTTGCRRLEGGVVGFQGSGAGTPIEMGRGLAVSIPKELSGIKNCGDKNDKTQKSGIRGKRGESGNKGLSARGKDAPYSKKVKKHETQNELSSQEFQERMSEIQKELVHELLSQNGIAKNDVCAVGVHGPPDYCWNSANLAAQTGLNVVDEFAGMDIAVSGQGSPLIPLPAWVLLHSPTRHRLVVDIGRQSRLMFLPSSNHATKNQIQYHRVGPGGVLIDLLVTQLTDGTQTFDDGGRLTVQGQLIPELFETWSSCFSISDPDVLLSQGLRSSDSKNWSLRDILCTAVHCIAGQMVAQIKEKYAPLLSEMEIFVTGGCRHHGLLMKQIIQELGLGKLPSLEKIRFDDETFEAMCVAVLAFLSVNQIPGNLPHLTGAETSRVLGRFTPGSPQNWARLLQIMSEIKPVVQTLRNAM